MMVDGDKVARAVALFALAWSLPWSPTSLMWSRSTGSGTFLQVGSPPTGAAGGQPSLIDACSGVAALEVERFEGKTFGAVVRGFDPERALLDELSMAAISRLLQEHLVLVLPDVAHRLTPAMHVQLSRMLGPVDPVLSSAPSYLAHGKFNSPDAVRRAVASGVAPEALKALGSSMLLAAAKVGDDDVGPSDSAWVSITRVVKEPRDFVAFGEGWHTDLTYRPAPPFAAMLVARQLPRHGGNTWFSDMRAAWAHMPRALRERVGHRRANHTDGHDLWSVHPVKRTDHKDGHVSLFANKAFTRHLTPDTGGAAAAADDDDDDDDDDDLLLGSVLDWVERFPQVHPESFLNISWAEGQVVLWDQRYTQHAAVADYTERREMHRVIVSGTIPF